MIEHLKGNQEIVNYRGNFNIRAFINREYENYPQHWHTDAEIIMPVENAYSIVIDETTYNLNAKDILFIPSGELHQIYAPNAGYRIILQFDCTIFYNLRGFHSTLQLFHPCVMVTPVIMPDIHGELSALIQDMTSEYFSTLPLREASVYSMLIRFFTILGRNHMNKNDKFASMKNQKQLEYINLFFNVCNFIDERCTENIKLDDIANIAGFSKFHFVRIFKQVMNISCYDYLVNRRLTHAERLLIDSDLSVMQVAMKSGFSSLATFNRLFKAKRHCTPTEYRLIHGVYSG